MSSKIFSAVLLLAVLLAGFMFRAELFYTARYVDKTYLAESLKDLKARFETPEEWVHDGPARDYDYAWLEQAKKPVWIAHRLGGSGEAENTFAAFHESRRKGFSFFEVDLWLDGDGVLRCHHGPQPPALLQSGDCTLPELALLLNEGEYLVMDIKTDFEKTFMAILSQAAYRRKQFIFQLYLPADAALFDQYAAQYDLPGPIVSVYNSRRSLAHVFEYAQEAGIRAFAFPYPRMAALKERDERILLLTYPVTNCEELRAAAAQAVQGFYIRSDLDCS